MPETLCFRGCTVYMTFSNLFIESALLLCTIYFLSKVSKILRFPHQGISRMHVLRRDFIVCVFALQACRVKPVFDV